MVMLVIIILSPPLNVFNQLKPFYFFLFFFYNLGALPSKEWQNVIHRSPASSNDFWTAPYTCSSIFYPLAKGYFHLCTSICLSVRPSLCKTYLSTTLYMSNHWYRYTDLRAYICLLAHVRMYLGLEPTNKIFQRSVIFR